MSKAMPVIDCDVHQSYRSHHELVEYLPEPHRTRVLESGFGYPGGMYYSCVGGVRKDSFPESGGVPGSDYGLLKQQYLDEYNIRYCVLNGGGMLGISLMSEQEFPAALATAYNEWLINSWLGLDERFLGSMMVAVQNPEAAAREIRRAGGHKQIVQVIISGVTPMPIGQRYYHEIFAACAEMGLPIAMHPGGNQSSGTAPVPTPVGFPQYYLEWHTLLSSAYMAQLASLIVEGVFEKYPTLKVVLIEGGVAWLPAFLWRLDKNYKSLRKQTPWLERLPSEYVKQHVRLTTQPAEEPPKKEYLLQIYDMIGAEDILMFASDYPHWDFDEPAYAVRGLSSALKQRILYETAAELYGVTV